MDLDSYVKLTEPYIRQAVKGDFDIKKIAAGVQQRANTLCEIPPMLDFYDTFPAYSNDLYLNKKMKTNPDVAKETLPACRAVLAEITDWTHDTLHERLMELPAKLEKKNGQVLFPLRVAISGKPSTPGGAIEIAEILGKKETLRRLDLSIAQLENE
jgi:glutamyl-tRNA synthetase